VSELTGMMSGPFRNIKNISIISVSFDPSIKQKYIAP
jgi:hypothetical protein